MFSHEYEYFGFFSENVILRYCEWILLLFLMFCWSLFDDVLTACDDQRTTFACIFHGASMCEISKNLHFPWENELFSQTRLWKSHGRWVQNALGKHQRGTGTQQKVIRETWKEHEQNMKFDEKRGVVDSSLKTQKHSYFLRNSESSWEPPLHERTWDGAVGNMQHGNRCT